MKTLKRIVSILCSVALLSSTVVGASAASPPMIHGTSAENGYYTDIEWKNDKDFIITGYIDGIVQETVEGSVGSDKLLATNYGNRKQSASQTISASSIITKADTTEQLPPSEEFLSMMPLAFL